MIGQLKHRDRRQQRQRTLANFTLQFCPDQRDRINRVLSASYDRIRIARNDEMSVFANMAEFAIERRS